METIDFKSLKKQIDFESFEKIIKSKSDIHFEQKGMMCYINNKHGSEILDFPYKNKPTFEEIMQIMKKINSWYRRDSFINKIVSLLRNFNNTPSHIKDITEKINNVYGVKNIMEDEIKKVFDEDQNKYNLSKYYIQKIAETIDKRYGHNLITDNEIIPLFRK